MKKRLVKAGATVALTVGLGVATAGSALANSNWAYQIGPAGYGCYAWTTWGGGYVTGHVYSQSGHSCEVVVQQSFNGVLGANNSATTSGAGTTADTLPYYYGGGHTDVVSAADFSVENVWYPSGTYS